MSNSLNIRSKISLHPKDKSLSQGELAKLIDASREIIGKYGRNENLPSNEMFSKMAKAFVVTIDYLIGNDENSSLEKEALNRINDIQKMCSDTKSVLLNVIDTYYKILKLNKLLLNKLYSHEHNSY